MIYLLILLYGISMISVFTVWTVFLQSRNGELRLQMVYFFGFLSFGFAIRFLILCVSAYPNAELSDTMNVWMTLIAVSPLTIQSFCLARFLKHYYKEKK